ncbi:MAG: dihydropyrimidinase, partial [Acidobacteria bacterium]|nr:dihydropyrimidinase [Acidobacteriota bacterium]
MAEFDTVVRGGTVVTADGVRSADVGISGGVVRAVEPGLGHGEEEISAQNRLVIPGGVDAHTHIEQKSSMGLMCADDYHSGTVS